MLENMFKTLVASLDRHILGTEQQQEEISETFNLESIFISSDSHISIECIEIRWTVLWTRKERKWKSHQSVSNEVSSAVLALILLRS